METPQEKAAKAKIAERLENLSVIDANSLQRSDLSGARLDFGGAKLYFEGMLRLLGKFRGLSYDGLPLNKLEIVWTTMDNALNRLKEVQEFSAQKYPSNPIQERDNLQRRIIELYEDAEGKLTPIINLLSPPETELDRLISEQKKALSKFEGEKEAARNEMKELKKEGEETLSIIHATAGKAGVAHHSEDFKKQADHHKTYARAWLIACAIIGVISAIAIYLITDKYVSEIINIKEPIKIIPTTISRLLVISMFFFAVIWSSRNYNAHRHNEVVNRHRQNALSTFETFVKAAEGDKEVKNAVLFQATQCIFSVQRCGYLKGDSEPALPNSIISVPSQIMPKSQD